VIPDFVRIAKLPAVPRFTGAGPTPNPLTPVFGSAGLELELPSSLSLHPATKAATANANNHIRDLE
jgi:hypothetical protein